MNQLTLEAWHLLAMLLTIIVGIFKNDIAHLFNAYSTVREQSHLKGKDVELLGPDGHWQAIRIVDYQLPIPMIKRGGVFVTHNIKGDKSIQEKISFSNWRNQRMRMLST